MLKLINQSFANAQYEAENLVSFGQDEKALGAVANGLICIPLLNTEFPEMYHIWFFQRCKKSIPPE